MNSDTATPLPRVSRERLTRIRLEEVRDLHAGIAPPDAEKYALANDLHDARARIEALEASHAALLRALENLIPFAVQGQPETKQGHAAIEAAAAT